MREFVFEKAPGGHLVPFSDEDKERMKAWKAGDLVRVKAAKMRDPIQHRRFFKLLQETVKQLPEGSELTVDQLLIELKIRTGRVEPRISPVPTKLARELRRGVKRLRQVYRWMAGHGAPLRFTQTVGRLGKWLDGVANSEAANTVLVPQSIDFASMDESEFRAFYQECSKIICRDYLDVDEEEFEQMLSLL